MSVTYTWMRSMLMAQNMNNQTFAQILRSERERRCWTQAQVGEKVDTSTVNVSRWERGISKPGLYHKQKLCEAFGFSYEEFHFRSQPLEEPGKKLPVEQARYPSTFCFNEPLL